MRQLFYIHKYWRHIHFLLLFGLLAVRLQRQGGTAVHPGYDGLGAGLSVINSVQYYFFVSCITVLGIQFRHPYCLVHIRLIFHYRYKSYFTAKEPLKV